MISACIRVRKWKKEEDCFHVLKMAFALPSEAAAHYSFEKSTLGRAARNVPDKCVSEG